MKLSVITVNYNNDTGLRHTMASVLAQLPTEYVEYIVVDGGSVDGSQITISNQAARLASWVSEKDLGIYDAMNKGISRASGDYIMFLNSGDCLSHVGSLRDCVALLQKQPNTDILYGNVSIVTRPENRVELINHWRYPTQLTLTFFRNQTINHQASLIKATLFEEFGLYPIQYRLAADYWLYLRCILHDKKFTHLPTQLVEYDGSGLSATDSYKSYFTEMDLIWKTLVPIYAQELVTDNLRLLNITDARLVKLAAAGNYLLRKLRRK